MGDHVVPIVKAWYKLTWRFAHRHLFFKDTYSKGSETSIYVGYETLFHVYLHDV